MRKIWNGLQGLKPALMMVVVQAALAGANIFYKMAPTFGMSLRILIAYRFLIATAFIVPLALVVERKKRPKLTWVVVYQAFFCGLFGGAMSQNLYAQSLALTSATFAAAMANLVPAITFILAVTLGMEKLGLDTKAGKAKVIGTLMCISGAMLLTFYKGKEINIWSTNVDLLHRHGVTTVPQHLEAGNRLLGALLIVCCCLSSAVGLIFQAKMIRNYSCPYSATALLLSMGAIQAAVFALCMERGDMRGWKLGWDVRLLAVSYTGIVASGLTFTLMSWCVKMRGPLFVSVFNPLMLVLVAIAGSLLLEEKLHLGSVLGAVIIVFGLYVVLWGKAKELKRISQLIPSKSPREPERIEIIFTSSANNNDDSNGNKIGFINSDRTTEGVSMVYGGDAFEGDILSAKDKDEDEEEEGEREVGISVVNGGEALESHTLSAKDKDEGKEEEEEEKGGSSKLNGIVLI